MASQNLTTPVPRSVTIPAGTYNLVAFYYPDHNTSWDDKFKAPFLGNFYPCTVQMTIAGKTGTFRTAEAAFQATKWWMDQAIRQEFEQAATGTDAFHISRRHSKPDSTYCGLTRDGAMKQVLTAKFADPEFQAALLQTGDAYLLEHRLELNPPQPGQPDRRDTYWSDGYDGTGGNNLGLLLMDIRGKLTGGRQGRPENADSVADFTIALGKILSTPVRS
jgi:predicted NAD-dependent protein-ADP-ribosyltransferase YbiA (DUF1768 family)